MKTAVVYHGSFSSFDKFDMSKIGSKNQVNQYGEGWYFADTPERARLFGDNVYAVKLSYSTDRKTARKNGREKDFAYDKSTGIWVIPYAKTQNVKILGKSRADSGYDIDDPSFMDKGLSDINKEQAMDLYKMPKDTWIDDKTNDSMWLTHSVGKRTNYFRLDKDKGNREEGEGLVIFVNYFPTLEEASGKDYSIFDTFMDVNAAKKDVDEINKLFDMNPSADLEEILYYHNLSKSQLETQQSNNPTPEPQFEQAKKAGYVQGVCECAAIVSGDKAMANKLLSEMKVTKAMAKKYAEPETYKALEQTVFAPRQEQKIERGRHR